MQAAVIDAVPGTATICSDVEIDEPGIGEVLVRVAATGVCHSDVSSIDGTMPMFVPPFVLGHEPAGIVEAVGPGVRHLAAGDHVIATLLGPCGHCAACVTGAGYRCANGGAGLRGKDLPSRLRRGDVPLDQHCGLGGFAEQILVGEQHLVRIDPTLPLEQACLLGCGVLTGAGAAFTTTPVTPGSTVVVIGCGGVGLATIQAARIAYARRIVAIDVNSASLELAKRCGATDTVDAGASDPEAAVTDLLGGGADFVFEAIGRPETAQQGLAMTGMGGTLTMVGLLPLTATLTVTAIDLMMGKSIRQSLMGSGRPAADIPRLVEHALAGRLDLAAMVTETHRLVDAPQALDRLQHGHVVGRAVVTMS